MQNACWRCLPNERTGKCSISFHVDCSYIYCVFYCYYYCTSLFGVCYSLFFLSPLSIRSFVPHLLLLSLTSPRHPLSWTYCIAMISICATVQIQMVGHCLYRDSEPYFMGFDLQCANFIYSAAWIWRGKKSAAKQKQQSKIADCDWR